MSATVPSVPAGWVPYSLTGDCDVFRVPFDTEVVPGRWAPALTITPPPPRGANVVLDVGIDNLGVPPLAIRVSRETGVVIDECALCEPVWLTRYVVPADIPPGGSFVIELLSPLPSRWNGSATVHLKPAARRMTVGRAARLLAAARRVVACGRRCDLCGPYAADTRDAIDALEDAVAAATGLTAKELRDRDRRG